jgi:uracil-DNA glycosylase
MLHKEIGSCSKCPLPDDGPHRFAGRYDNRIMLVGQSPAKPSGPEGRPFGSGNGRRRLFDWLGRAGFSEEEFRSKAYMTSITKCYPGPSPGGKGDRKPGKEEIAGCSGYLERELDLMRPELLIPVGQLAISIMLGDRKLSEMIGKRFELQLDGWSSIVVPLPHPSGASLWNNLPENQALVIQAAEQIGKLRLELGL